MLPLDLRPMLAYPSGPFDSPDHVFEIKWDGIRALACLDGGTTLYSRQGRELTPRYPELASLHRHWPRETIIDGEIVCLVKGKPSFYHLQRRNFQIKPNPKQIQDYPVLFIAFDVLWQKKDLRPWPLLERKALLGKTEGASHLVISEHISTHGLEYFRLVAQRGLEGIVAKEKTSPYLSGQRSRYWLKCKVVQKINLTIFGYLPGMGGFASLILGAPWRNTWRYIGNVGSGFSHREKDRLLDLFRPGEKPPLQGLPKDVSRQARWVRPDLVCQVNYLELTPEGLLRHPSYKGLVDGPFHDHPWGESKS